MADNEELTELEQIQRRGANAYQLGIGYFDNPYYKRENMPVTTGEETATWNAKAEAWTLGWEMEKTIKPRLSYGSSSPAFTCFR